MTARKPKAATTPAPDFIPDALALRTTDARGKAYRGYQWPLEVGTVVECPDWKATATCGNGFHGYVDGLGSRDQCSNDPTALWWIVEVMRSECILIDGDKSKFPRCRIAYVGSFAGALAKLPMAMVTAIFAQTEASQDAKTTTGYCLVAATTGDCSAAATTGNRSAAATTGYCSAAATTGYGAAAATTGYRSAAATTGDGSAAATTGNRSAAATTGDCSAAATTGNRSAAATTGDGSAAATTGKSSIAAAIGADSTATAGEGGAIMLAYYDTDVFPYRLVNVGAFMVGTNGVEPGKTYRLSADGKPVVVTA